MYVIINGAFGIGKASVAQELRRAVPGSFVFDPEKIGFILQRLPGYRQSDFQHLPQWRRLTVLGAKSFGTRRGVVIIPMAQTESRPPPSLPTLPRGLQPSPTELGLANS